MLVQITKKIVAAKRGRDFVLFLLSAFRKAGTLSMFNIAYYFHPLDPYLNPGVVTKTGRKGISGIAVGKDINIPPKVELLVDGKVVNTTYATQKIYYPVKYYGEFIGFYFPMNKVWAHIEKGQKIEVLADEIPLSYRAGLFRKEMIPNYGSLVEKKGKSEKNIIDLVSEGRLINKFGRVQIPRNINKNWGAMVFSSFAPANEMFEKNFRKQLFVFYGGLLGFARSGGIIAHDCDLDLAYFSEETDPLKVRKEFYGIAEKLAGEYRDITVAEYKINFTKMRLSVTPVWINSDGEFSCTFAYVGDVFRVVKEDILPLRKIDYEGYMLNLPANPESVVKYIYGRGWKYPDPGWKWLIEYKMRSQIFKARLSEKQVKELNKIAAPHSL